MFQINDTVLKYQPGDYTHGRKGRIVEIQGERARVIWALPTPIRTWVNVKSIEMFDKKNDHYLFIKNYDYIVISELPEEQQEPLKKWLYGQTLPIVYEEGKNSHNCCYKWDYLTWLKCWKKNKIAPVYD